MKIVRTGHMITIALPGWENAVVCGKCGVLFREKNTFTGRPRASCPMCRERGPFRKATEADITAYAKSREPKPSDYLKAVGLLIVFVAVAVLIAWWVVDA